MAATKDHNHTVEWGNWDLYGNKALMWTSAFNSS